MTSDGVTQARPGVDRPITRADIEAKLDQLRGAAEPGTQKARGVGIAAVIAGGIVLVIAAYIFGRRKGRKRRTIVEVRRV
jgi:hypothetical protein